MALMGMSSPQNSQCSYESACSVDILMRVIVPVGLLPRPAVPGPIYVVQSGRGKTKILPNPNEET